MGALFGQKATFDQVGGPSIELVVFGDEFYARYETVSGYTVIQDEAKGVFCFAELLDGELVSTGVPATQKPPAGARRHLKEAPEVHNAKLKLAWRDRGYPGPPPGDRTYGPNKGLLSGRRVSSGDVRGLTVIVEFQDIAATVTANDVAAMLNEEGYSGNGNRGSVRDYFAAMSSGALDFTNDVVGPIKLSHDRQYYTKNLLVAEALRAVSAQGIDLSRYDSKKEGVIDALSFLYAGSVQYVEWLWPHNHYVDITIDGVRANFYLITALGGTPDRLVIGTFCHEAGHLLCRFPDLYDYGNRDGDFEKGSGLGAYCLMSAGNHLNGGRAPAPVCAYLRDLVGWCPNVVDLSVAGRYEARHGAYDTVMKYGSGKTNEYFLVENRLSTGYDRYLPSSGLAVYHCDIQGSNEWGAGTSTRHYQCALLQADGHRDLETTLTYGDRGDFFSASDGVALSHATLPSSNRWDGSESGLVLSGIKMTDDVIAFVSGEEMSGAEIREDAYPDVVIPDNDVGGIAHTIDVARAGTITDIEVSLDIRHTYVGDLRVELIGPEGHRAVLHNRDDGEADDLRVELRLATTPSLAVFAGRQAHGPWTLRVSDLAGQDLGKLVRWGILLRVDPAAGPSYAVVGKEPAPQGTTHSAPRPGEHILEVAESGSVLDVQVTVDVQGAANTLVLALASPDGQSVQLHNRRGAGDRVSASYTPLTAPALAAFTGCAAQGAWTLRSEGTPGTVVRTWSLNLTVAGSNTP